MIDILAHLERILPAPLSESQIHARLDPCSPDEHTSLGLMKAFPRLWVELSPPGRLRFIAIIRQLDKQFIAELEEAAFQEKMQERYPPASSPSPDPTSIPFLPPVPVTPPAPCINIPVVATAPSNKRMERMKVFFQGTLAEVETEVRKVQDELRSWRPPSHDERMREYNALLASRGSANVS